MEDQPKGTNICLTYRNSRGREREKMKAEILKEAVEENFTELGKDLGLYHKGASDSQAEWMAHEWPYESLSLLSLYISFSFVWNRTHVLLKFLNTEDKEQTSNYIWEKTVVHLNWRRITWQPWAWCVAECFQTCKDREWLSSHTCSWKKLLEDLLQRNEKEIWERGRRGMWEEMSLSDNTLQGCLMWSAAQQTLRASRETRGFERFYKKKGNCTQWTVIIKRIDRLNDVRHMLWRKKRINLEMQGKANI